MVKQSSQVDIIINGAGMVGLSLALALGQAGFQVLVVEAQNITDNVLSQDESCDLRVVAIAKSTVRFFEQLGVWGQIKSFRLGQMENMRVWDQEFSGRVDFFSAQVLEENLGYIVEQKNILHALRCTLKKLSNVKVRTNSALQQVQKDPSFVYCNISEKERLTAKLLVGCDGGNSWVRNISDIQAHVLSYQQQAIVATIQSKEPHKHTAYQRFNRTGALALLPLYQDNLLSIVWSAHEDLIPGLLALSDRAFEVKLTKEIDEVLGPLALKSQRVAFPLKQSHAKSYVADRVVLLGDAAHTFHPLAGQGVNFGLKDAQVLATVLAEAKHKKRDIGLPYLLKRYERKRRWHNQMMIYLMRAFKEGFGTSHTATTFLRNEGLDLVNRTSLFKQFFIKNALG